MLGCVVNSEPAPDLASDFLAEYIGQGFAAVRVEVVHHQVDGLGGRVFHRQVAGEPCELKGGSIAGGSGKVAARLGLHRAENISRSATLVFAISSGLPPWYSRRRRSDIGMQGHRLPKDDHPAFSGLLEGISKHRKKLFGDRYLSEVLKAWPANGTLDRFLNSVRRRAILVRSLLDFWPAVPPQDGTSVAQVEHVFRQLERLQREQPTHFSPLVQDRYKSGKLESFDCHFHPDHGVLPHAELRKRLWNAYRDRIEDYLGPDEFHRDLALDNRFSSTEHEQVLWCGVLAVHELEAFRASLGKC